MPPGCLQEALLALNEAVRIAQQHNDNAALAHALGALCRILATASPAAVTQLTEPGVGIANPTAQLSQLLKILKRYNASGSVLHDLLRHVQSHGHYCHGSCSKLCCLRCYDTSCMAACHMSSHAGNAKHNHMNTQKHGYCQQVVQEVLRNMHLNFEAPDTAELGWRISGMMCLAVSSMLFCPARHDTWGKQPGCNL